MTLFRHTAPVSLHNCWLWSSFHEKVPPEPPHASAQRGEAIPVSHIMSLYCFSSQPIPTFSFFNFPFGRCKFASCTQSFFHKGNLKRHVRYAHGDKDKYFKVCLGKRMCPQDGAKGSYSNSVPLNVLLDVQ